MAEKAVTEKEKKETSDEKKQNIAKEKLSDIELAELYLQKIHLIKIEGQLHAFNGKWYFPLDKKQLSVSVKNELYPYVIKSGYRLVNSISKALIETFDYTDYSMAEYSGWMGFENGVWNVYSNQFCFHGERPTVIPNTYILQGISYPFPYSNLYANLPHPYNLNSRNTSLWITV